MNTLYVVLQYQIVSILDFIGAKDDGGGGGETGAISRPTSITPVKSSPPPLHPPIYRPDALPIVQPTASKH